jgi:hypothetical protein
MLNSEVARLRLEITLHEWKKSVTARHNSSAWLALM